MRLFAALLCTVALFTGCDEKSKPSTDAGVDSGADAGRDSGVDAGSDAGPTCECAGMSTCCDGCHPRNDGMACNDGLTCSATSACNAAGACVLATPTCTVTTPECQARSCDETSGCGSVTSIREGFSCNDNDANTYDDECSSGSCVGTPLACTVGNGGCVGTEVCVGHDPNPNTCECASGRYQVTADTVLDTTTGRTWQRAQAPSTYTYTQAETYCSGLAIAGGGWRLPTGPELVAIHYGNISQAPNFTDPCAFPGTAADYFRTSTAGTVPDARRVVNFGGCCGAPDGDDAMALRVRCVR